VKRDRGTAMIELALILPLLVILMVGIIDFGRAYSAQISITGAAREGARTLALGGSAAAVTAAVNGAKGAATVTSVVQTACPTSSPDPGASSATVVVNASFQFGIPFVPLGTRTFSAKASMRCGL
jgi:Flp pilus assembly protein TadG